MPRKLVILADPGIDAAFAVALALNDPDLDVVGLLPTAGNVSAEQATANVHTLLGVLDPPKWPRLAAALPARYEADGLALHGPGGLGGATFPSATRHALHPADKVLVELAHEHPRGVTLVCLGPLTTLATALDRDPTLPAVLSETVIVGGAWRVPGNAGPAAEFGFWLDPDAAKRVLKAELNPLVLPLDVTRRLVFSPTDLLELPNPDSRTCQFLRQIVPFGIRASSNLLGVEGFLLTDVLGVAAVARPGVVTADPQHADVEARGDLTRGMLVVDARRDPAGPPTARVATDVTVGEVREYMRTILSGAG
ncbi:MAG: nucleoside hydrolase [Gemmataceae bacterium]|nr:nucleoside hydrolase [Gemmataceae bacterium]